MARRLASAEALVIGVLPAAGAMNLGPFLVRLASAMAGFVRGKVGVIPRWRSWGRDPGGGSAQAGAARVRGMGPNVVAIVPPAARESRSAALALQPAVWTLPEGVARVLVDLTGYSEPGAWPGAGVIADGIIVAVPARARRAQVEALLGAVPPGKTLGTILVG